MIVIKLIKSKIKNIDTHAKTMSLNFNSYLNGTILEELENVLYLI